VRERKCNRGSETVRVRVTARGLNRERDRERDRQRQRQTHREWNRDRERREAEGEGEAEERGRGRVRERGGNSAKESKKTRRYPTISQICSGMAAHISKSQLTCPGKAHINRLLYV
jgi:hypothetical protein